MSTSASKSSANTSATTENIDKRIVADGGAIVLGDGSKLETVSDDIALGAINAMLQTTQTGAALAGKLNEDSLTLAQNLSGQSAKIQTEALDTVRESNASTSAMTENAMALIAKNAQPATAINSTALYIAGGIAALAVGAALLKKS